MKKSGYIQQVFIPAKAPVLDTATLKTNLVAVDKERNVVTEFTGLLQMFRKLTTTYKSGCDKVYIFFDKIEIK